MTRSAFIQASRRLASRYAAGCWIGAIRPAFSAGRIEHEQQVETYPAHFLVALWEPPAEGSPLLPRWPAVAAIASPDSQAALLELVSHLPPQASLWLAGEEVDWALVAAIVRQTDRNLAAYHRLELDGFIARCRAVEAEAIRQTYSDRDPGFEALKARLLPPGDNPA
ncbi:hypothetical protein [Eleftheria terrae]|uniref:hypothetical protein n=1 Tax=Eleftheria terrae TaxID=1597781 RepID=UPI00263B8943|nr:hypothetical protein [Eleftheria terrae]WKB52174.1 hypothetical protein N7L95_20630 [Eleftheria terrae]